jgi:hypothetical protein
MLNIPVSGANSTFMSRGEHMSETELSESGRTLHTVEVKAVIVGRDKTPVYPDDVQRLAAMGCKDIEICNWFGIDGNTLRYNFSVELLKGRETLIQSLRQAQIKFALNGSVPLLIWLGKQLLGQAETPEMVYSDEEGGEIRVTVNRPVRPAHDRVNEPAKVKE